MFVEKDVSRSETTQIRRSVNFMLFERGRRSAVAGFIAKTRSSNEFLDKVEGKSKANAARIREENKILRRIGCLAKLQRASPSFLNNLIDQDYQIIERRIR